MEQTSIQWPQPRCLPRPGSWFHRLNLGGFAHHWRIFIRCRPSRNQEWHFSGIGTVLEYFRPGAAKQAGL